MPMPDEEPEGPVTREEILQCQCLLWKLSRHAVISDSIGVNDLIFELEQAYIRMLPPANRAA